MQSITLSHTNAPSSLAQAHAFNHRHHRLYHIKQTNKQNHTPTHINRLASLVAKMLHATIVCLPHTVHKVNKVAIAIVYTIAHSAHPLVGFPKRRTRFAVSQNVS
jgi:hypothetical protein